MTEDFFRKICTSHFICKVACERELETEQRLQHIDFTSPSGHSCESFSFSWTVQTGAWGPSLSGTCSHSSIFSPTGLVSKLTGGPEGPFCWVVAFSTTSCHQLIWSPTPSGVLRAPSAGWWLSLPHLVSNFSGPQLTDFLSSPSYIIVHWLPVFTELYNSSITHSIFGMVCLIVIKQKQLSCSSQVTLFWCISLWVYHEIFTLSHFFSQACHRNVSLPSGASLWNGRFGRVEGQYTTIGT